LFPASGLERVVASVEGAPARFRLPVGSACFDGHFEGAPVLPGVVQLALALEACVAHEGGGATLVAVRDVRFSRALAPGDEIEIAIAAGATGDARRFVIRRGADVATTGVLVLSRSREPGADD
jgi:3-hydroxymyristoyl/3-hydroxydecanoyl-(acyl carrier protein) dehydratase